MNTAEQWQALSDKDKVGAIIKQVLKWTCKEVGIEWKRSDKSATPYPVASWNDQQGHWCVFYHEQEDAKVFDPLHSLDDAWNVVRRLNHPQNGDSAYHYYYQFIERLKEIVGSDELFDLFYCDMEGDHLTPERLCMAAYMVVDDEFC